VIDYRGYYKSKFLAIQTKYKHSSLTIWLDLKANIWWLKHMQIVSIGDKSIKEVFKIKQCIIL
jgi:hypothetical protein